MPQTVEAIDHARAADVPIIVAINKMDRPDASPDRVLQQLSERGLVPESWGGDTITVQVSALQKTGIDELLEQISLVAEVEELRATPEGRARGTVLEANLEDGRGPVATVIVESGTLRVGDPTVAGAAWGKVKALVDDHGDHVKEALPSMPVQVLGFSEPPQAGDELRVAKDQATARTLGEARAQRFRLSGHLPVASAATGAKLEDLFEQIQRGETATLNLVLKADVQGSLEAVSESLRKLERDDVKLSFVHRGVGGVTENDVQLARASNATIIGFNVRPDRRAREMAEANDVEVRTYEIIYKLLEDIEAALLGLLAPEYEEVVTGEAEVRQVFRIPRVGAVAGCYVREGTITRGSKVRFLRDGAVIWKGTVTSLRRFKDDVREVQTGFECGVGLSDYQDLKEGDIIETFEERGERGAAPGGGRGARAAGRRRRAAAAGHRHLGGHLPRPPPRRRLRGHPLGRRRRGARGAQDPAPAGGRAPGPHEAHPAPLLRPGPRRRGRPAGGGGAPPPARRGRRARGPRRGGRGVSRSAASDRTGLVVVDKEAGWTSHDVVARVRKVFGQRRVGHAGTLDPDATGVLLVGVGRATRLLRFLTASEKSYTGEVVLGTATHTLDASGEVVGTWDMSGVTLDQARVAAASLTGEIEQVPPMVSALKVDGRRLHALAREGIEVERAARPVTVHRFEVAATDEAGVLAVDVTCSSGTYVRVLAADLGSLLGGGAHLRNLRRTSVGSFTEAEAHLLADLDPGDLLSPVEALRDLERLEVTDEGARLVGHGLPVDRVPLGATGPGPFAILDGAGRLLAVYEATDTDRLRASVVLGA
jgi:translation initiation factor IF-2/tRNA pseudouridine(55) synthase